VSWNALTNCSFGVRILLELDYTGAARATVRLVLNLSTLDLANGGEKLDKILVASRPWQVADVDGVAGLSTRGSEVGEGVGRVGGRVRLEACGTATRGTAIATAACSVAATATETTSKATATAKSSASAEATAEAAPATETSATSKPTWSSSKTILANF
jgi:hypothetical protein